VPEMMTMVNRRNTEIQAAFDMWIGERLPLPGWVYSSALE